MIKANKIAKLHSFESVIEYELNVKDLEGNANTLCVQSAEVILNDIRWKVEACRDNGNQEIKKLHMSLIAIFDGESVAWSCEAKATFKLLAIDEKDPTILGFETYNFNKDDPKRSIDDFIPWDDLFENHVKDDYAIFEITVFTMTPNRAAKIDESSAIFDVRLNNVNRLGYEYSNELIVRGIRWKVLAMKIDENLGIFLFANGDDMGIDVSWNASANFQLISSTTNTVSRSFENISFDWTHLNHGFSKFVGWTDFMNTNKKFVENNKAIIKVELSVSEPIKERVSFSLQ